MYKRICPICRKEISYKSASTGKNLERLNKPCRQCHMKIHNSSTAMRECTSKRNRENNPVHTENGRSAMLKNFSKMRGENNPFCKGLVVLLREKYGNDDGIIKWKKAISDSTSGEKSHRYGKPVSLSCGKGWSGWYKNWYFRSSIELFYMINVIERFNLEWESAEKNELRISYELFGKKRTYVADFLIAKKYLVECKPKLLMNSAQVKAKQAAANIFCKEKGLKYKLTAAHKFSNKELLEMHDNGIIEILESKLKNLRAKV